MTTCLHVSMLYIRKGCHPMFTVAVIGQKGGNGKTTVAIELATTAAAVGEDVAVIDLDPQASAAKWRDRRTVDNPAVVSAQVSRLRQTLTAAKTNGADLVVIDSPGKSDSAAVEAARVADLVLIPRSDERRVGGE